MTTTKAFSETIALSAVLAVAAALSGCATPGVGAAVRRDPAGLQRVLDRPDHGGENLGTLLSNSVSFNCAECVRILLKAGAKPDVAALKTAALAGNQKIAAMLIEAGADPAAAMASIHAETRKWIGGCCLTPEQASGASALFKTIDRERASFDVPASTAQASRPAAAPAVAPAAKTGDFALIVGVEKYDRAPAEFTRALGVPAGNTVLLSGERATRSGLAKYVEGWLPDNVDKDATVYFYFAGLGATGPKDGRAYLMPFDGDPQYLEQTAYPLKRLYEKLGALSVKRAIVILEAGFPGAGRADDGFNSADGKVALLAAADGDQAAGIDAEKGRGLFSEYLFEGLDSGSGPLTLKALFDGARAKTMAQARREGRVQVPLFESGGTATDAAVLREKRP